MKKAIDEVCGRKELVAVISKATLLHSSFSISIPATETGRDPGPAIRECWAGWI